MLFAFCCFQTPALLHLAKKGNEMPEGMTICLLRSFVTAGMYLLQRIFKKIINLASFSANVTTTELFYTVVIKNSQVSARKVRSRSTKFINQHMNSIKLNFLKYNILKFISIFYQSIVKKNYVHYCKNKKKIPRYPDRLICFIYFNSNNTFCLYCQESFGVR